MPSRTYPRSDFAIHHQAIVENRLIAKDWRISCFRARMSGARVQRVARCGKCRGEFDPAVERVEGECRYHDGDFEHDMESDTWIDWDEDVMGRWTRRRTEAVPGGVYVELL
ncbi:hypothetical protein BC629DRAFT_559485 [Irpex lacteus]|nr:hypothetical protein BC629DRAFT_559485 [Irpex lacteus]